MNCPSYSCILRFNSSASGDSLTVVSSFALSHHISMIPSKGVPVPCLPMICAFIWTFSVRFRSYRTARYILMNLLSKKAYISSCQYLRKSPGQMSSRRFTQYTSLTIAPPPYVIALQRFFYHHFSLFREAPKSDAPTCIFPRHTQPLSGLVKSA